jgi:drug/metabolite transporter (DMT)-like permease
MRRPAIATGVLLAAIAAVAFGLTTPVVAWAGRDVHPLATASLLYLGAAAVALVFLCVVPARGASLRRSDGPRLVLVAVAGGAIAPALLAWGLQRSGATVGALLLNLEAVFTILLARAFFREPIGLRVGGAVIAMVLGGVALTLESATNGDVGFSGIVAVALATAAWAFDNTWTRPLAERDPFQVILVKGALGASLTAVAAMVRGEPLPATAPAVVLVACGATGYGASLYLYMLAQRRIGAGRTGSVFALAPFIGAALGWAFGDGHASVLAAAAAGLFGFGVYLHLTERHGHRHVHPQLEHDHMHRHDDDHHLHSHDPGVIGQHGHAHVHEHLEHDHDHAPDVHHGHGH